MGSAMSIDEPESPGGTLGSAQDVSIQSPDVTCNEVSNIVPPTGSWTYRVQGISGAGLEGQHWQ